MVKLTRKLGFCAIWPIRRFAHAATLPSNQRRGVCKMDGIKSGLSTEVFFTAPAKMQSLSTMVSLFIGQRPGTCLVNRHGDVLVNCQVGPDEYRWLRLRQARSRMSQERYSRLRQLQRQARLRAELRNLVTSPGFATARRNVRLASRRSQTSQLQRGQQLTRR